MGRQPQLHTLTGLIDAALSGDGGAVAVRGEAGAGKSALIDAALPAVARARVLRCAGVEFDTDSPFAAIHQLCTPLLDEIGALPGPQLAALRVSLGLSTGPQPQPHLVALAVAGLLTAAARHTPLICVVSDTQWLDRASAQVVAFLTRRLGAAPVAVLVELRENAGPAGFDSLPTVVVGPLPDSDARTLLTTVLPTPLDIQVQARILAEAAGNPLALLELASFSDPAGTAGGFAVPTGAQNPVEALFQRRLAGLAAETRLLLLLAAAEPTGDPVLFWRAAQRLGIPLTAMAPAEETGLLRIDIRVRFRHPLIRSAAYHAAAPAERRRVHHALAAVTDRERDPDRGAWHRAQAADGPDESVAMELVDAAGRARLRGGLAASAAFLDRAAMLSSGSRRDERLLDATQAWLDAGLPEEAAGLLGAVDVAALSARGKATAVLLNGRLAMSQRRIRDAVPPLVQAMRLLEPLEVRAARETGVDAVLATLLAGAPLEDLTAALARLPQPTGEHARTTELFLDGFARLARGDRRTAVPLLRDALADKEATLWDQRPMLAALVALELWDTTAYDSVLRWHADRARAAGAVRALPQTLEALAGAAIMNGRFGAAEGLHAEAVDLSSAPCNAPPGYCPIYLQALRGCRQSTTSSIDSARREAGDRGEGLLVGYTYLAAAVLDSGLGDYRAASTAAQTAWRLLPFGFTGMALRELVEAAARSGDIPLAAEAFAALCERTRQSPTAWALGSEAIGAALLADGPEAEERYRAAVDHLERAGAVVETARARLLYGEWLRRRRRRSQARAHLLGAYETMTALGIDGFAARAARELRTTGERVERRGTPAGADDLTPRERQVVRLAAAGTPTRDIAERLFLSHRTVDAHLRSIFRKLGITSRRELWNTALIDQDADSVLY